ncbi:hypothetical protein C6341_g22406 [Phytophthora cactorum]|nr:hypothetical protein C6341_g22406 [Phytophthora cactorum]
MVIHDDLSFHTIDPRDPFKFPGAILMLEPNFRRLQHWKNPVAAVLHQKQAPSQEKAPTMVVMPTLLAQSHELS